VNELEQVERGLLDALSRADLDAVASDNEAVHRAGEMAISAAYDFYNDDGVPPKNPERFYGVCTEAGEVVGFFNFEERGDAIFYGLGLRPDLTGRGLGATFVNVGLESAEARFGRKPIVLD
jgi:RimJ/RimL family protein N-acetyltransferase